MTFLEAFKQALRETGLSEAEIAERVTRSSIAFPLGAGILNAQVEPGTERALIEDMKAKGRWVEANKMAVATLLAVEMQRRQESN